MAGTFEVSNGKTTVKFQWTALTAKIQDSIEKKAKELWFQGFGDHGSSEDAIVWDDLSNQDKLDLVNDCIERVILGDARDKYVKEQLSTAKETAQVEAEEKFSLS